MEKFAFNYPEEIFLYFILLEEEVLVKLFLNFYYYFFFIFYYFFFLLLQHLIKGLKSFLQKKLANLCYERNA